MVAPVARSLCGRTGASSLPEADPAPPGRRSVPPRTVVVQPSPVSRRMRQPHRSGHLKSHRRRPSAPRCNRSPCIRGRVQPVELARVAAPGTGTPTARDLGPRDSDPPQTPGRNARRSDCHRCSPGSGGGPGRRPTRAGRAGDGPPILLGRRQEAFASRSETNRGL